MLLRLPIVLLQHVAAFLPLSDVLTGVRCGNRQLSAPAALPLPLLLRPRIILLRHHCELNEYHLPQCGVPSALRTHVRALCVDAAGFYPRLFCALRDVAGLTVAKPMTLAEDFPALELLQLQHVNITMHDVAVDTVFGATNRTNGSEALPPQWQLHTLRCFGPHAFVSDSGTEQRSALEHLRLHDNWLARLLPQHSTSLRELDIRLQTSPHGLTLAERVQQQQDDQLLMPGIIRAIATAGLGSLERLRIEYEQCCTVDEATERNRSGQAEELSATDSGGENVGAFLNFGLHSSAKASLFARLFASLPSLTALHTSWFHPLLILPFLPSLPHLRALTFAGLLTFASLPWLARCANLCDLLLDFFIEEDELRSEWIAVPRFDSPTVHAIRSRQEEENEEGNACAQAVQAAASVFPSPAPPPALASPTATRSADVNISFFLFHALARLPELHNVQLQSTLQSRNCARVELKNLVLLQSLKHLNRLQVSSFFPSREEDPPQSPLSASLPLSESLDRVCLMLPQLRELILNIERQEDEEDEEEEEEEEDTEEKQKENEQEQVSPAVVSPASIPVAALSSAVVLPVAPLSSALRSSRLTKLGVWDGHGVLPSLGPPPCILTHLSPFLAAYRQLHSLTLIFCHVSQLRPLRFLAGSLASLCLYFSHTVLGTTQRSVAREDAMAVTVGGSASVADHAAALADLSTLDSLHKLHWLIVHGSGDARSCFTANELIHLGSVVSNLPRLRNVHLENQPSLTPSVWRAWRAQRVGFPHLASLSFKDCGQLGAEGVQLILHAIAEDRQRAQESSALAQQRPQCGQGDERLLANLRELNVLSTFDAANESSIALQRARAALFSLRETEAHSAQRIHIHHALLRNQDKQ